MAKKTIKINDIIFEKIKFRYEFMDYGRTQTKSLIGKTLLDSFYPAEIAKLIVNNGPTNIKYDGYCLSERVSEDMNAKQLHISELTAMLGYTKTDITKILQAAKNKELSIILVGLGGTGSNFLHWLYKLCEWTGKKQIFTTLKGYDDDDFDTPNLLRIPFNPENEATISSKKALCIPGKFKVIAQSSQFAEARLTADNLSYTTTEKRRTFIYGAPDIGTREWLTGLDMQFFAATHRDNEYSIVANPDVDNELMMETYGKINLSMFFLNHLSMTLDFLSHIGNPDFKLQDVGANQELFKKDFVRMHAEKMVNGFKAGAKKLYAMQQNQRMQIDINIPEETRR